jgi:iron(III) transport system ATP-binding protein
MEIKLEDITKSYGGKMVLDGITLTIDAESFTTLLGPSGCGKTTLLRMIAGLELPDAGRILFDDTPVVDRQQGIFVPPEKRHLSFVFQDFALWPHMTVFENVAFGLRTQGKTEGLTEIVESALRAVHLEALAGRHPEALSGGQQQRVAFARAIVTQPRCILFDEPFSALDAVLRVEMRQEVADFVRQHGMTAVFVTHDQLEAMSMSDRIAVLSAGRVEQYDDPERLYRAPRTPFVARFVGASNWIDAHHLFRPESARRAPLPEARAYPVVVAGSRFLGAQYEVRLRHGKAQWIYRTSERLREGASFSLYVPEQAIITC